RVAGGLHDEQPSKQELKENCKVQIPATESSVIDRNYKSGDNHHIEVYEVLGKKGEKNWEAEVVSLYTAHQRLRFGKPAVNPDCRKNFLFALHKGDCVKIYRSIMDRQKALAGKEEAGEVFIIRGIDTDGRMKIQHQTDARPWQHKILSPEYQQKYGTVAYPNLQSLKGRLFPVEVDVLGNVFPLF
ncbi:MAG: hypothetical protein LBN39_10270, partial [Planctomycetaceae bacterium]|nr:hypothetical protein [Planctomycetaceae bacterium]